jgi:hypothetical protein
MMQAILNRCSDELFSAKRKILGKHRARRGRLYCVGLGKTGTHSVAAMFSRTVRARHEAGALELMEKILARWLGQISESEFIAWLHQRDRSMALEVDSSTLNFEILDDLLREFDDARFVLTIRDCYSWCNSLINHGAVHRHKVHPLWRQMRRFENRFHHAPEEQILQDHGFLSLESYFYQWTSHNQTVLDKVPAERLLLVRTDELQKRAFEIAGFGGLPRRAVRVERTHEFQNHHRLDLLRQIDPRFIEAKAQTHCSRLMQRFFPEITSLNDAKL